MSRKHYVAVANAIREAACPNTSETSASLAELARRLAAIFASENRAFDRARFLAACGVE